MDVVNEDNKAVFLAAGKYQGYTDAWLSRFYQLADTPERYFALRAIADSGDYDEPYLIEALMNSGYSPATIRKMLAMLQKMSRGELKGVFAGAALRRFQEGLSTADQLQQDLLELGFHQQNLSKAQVSARLQEDTDRRLDTASILEAQYLAEQLTEPELRAELAKLGFSAARIGLRVTRILLKFRHRPEPEPLDQMRATLRAAALDAYTQGFSTTEELDERLARLGYSPEWLDLWREKADLELDLSIKKLKLQYLEEAYSKDQFTEDAYRSELLLAGVQTTKVHKLIDLANARKYIKPKPEQVPELSLAQMFEAWRLGALSASQVRAELDRRGYTLADISTLFAVEAPTPATLSTAQLLAAWKARVLTEAQLIAELKGRLYDDSDINILLATEKAGIKPPPAAKVKQLTESQIRALFARDLISAQEFEAALIAQGYSRLDALRLLNLETLKREPPEEEE